jgi:hypothetical protein
MIGKDSVPEAPAVPVPKLPSTFGLVPSLPPWEGPGTTNLDRAKKGPRCTQNAYNLVQRFIVIGHTVYAIIIIQYDQYDTYTHTCIFRISDFYLPNVFLFLNV